MEALSVVDRNLLTSLCWYMSARKTALRAALSFRVPMSDIDRTDMRVHYSGYFSNLSSAIELLRECDSLRLGFEPLLHARLVFDGFEDGEANYAYLRELRNSIIHRGLDITSAMHFVGTFPLILCAPKLQNQRGTKSFHAFDKYLLNVIAKCEAVVGPVMFECLTSVNLLALTIDGDAVKAEIRDNVDASPSMPDHVKTMALDVDFKPEWASAAHAQMVKQLSEALQPFNTSGVCP